VELLKAFEDGAEQYNELIVVRNIPVYSHCEHHLAPFFGKATVGYVPNGKIVGLSKLTRLVDCFAKRLQVQERMTMQIANALMEVLEPKAVGVVVRCRHLCMESRGIRTPGEETVTSAMLGELQPNLAMRTEFLALARED
jgi:GTP cyclohydrolase I